MAREFLPSAVDAKPEAVVALPKAVERLPVALVSEPAAHDYVPSESTSQLVVNALPALNAAFPLSKKKRTP